MSSLFPDDVPEPKPKKTASPFPATFEALKEAGYTFDNHAVCRGKECQADIEWWITPNGRKMPFDLMPTPESPASPHHSTCPAVQQFRK